MIWDYVAGRPKPFTSHDYQHACEACDVQWKSKSRNSPCWICRKYSKLKNLLGK